MENGYWYDWTSEDLQVAEEKANDCIKSYDLSAFETDAFLPYDAEEDVENISNLTAGEALMATQLAIWAFANTEGDDWWVKYYESMPTDVENKYQFQELPDNVKAFRKYLIHQQSQPLAPEDILFSDQYFITDSVVFTGSPDNSAVYNLILKIKLAAPIDPRDDLTLTATYSNGKSKEFALCGDNKLVPYNKGYYALPFNDITKTDAASVTLTISGRQYAEGIYFYEAKSEEGTPRETSQNLVGKATVMTPVSASVDLTYEMGTEAVSLYKKDAKTEQPLESAVFDFYGEKEGKSFLILENLSTDETGLIEVSNLPEGFLYYFLETTPPKGYQFDGEKKYYVDGEDPVVVFNQKNPETMSEPENPEESETPVEPDPQKETVQSQVSVEPETPEAFSETTNPVIFDTSADELSAKPSKEPNNADIVEPLPETGDTSALEISFLLLLMASLGILCCVIYKKD